jgi:nucleotide-binding universal stress UspA family protein
MSMKNILVHVETSGNAQAQVAAALEFAKAEDASRTTGLCIRPALPFVPGEIAQIPPEILESYNKTLDQEIFPATKKSSNLLPIKLAWKIRPFGKLRSAIQHSCWNAKAGMLT